MAGTRRPANPQELNAYVRQALAYQQAGNIAAAEQIYREVLRVEPHHYDVLHFLGVLLHQKGESEAGLRFVERSLKLNRKSLPALNSRGMLLAQLGRWKEALASFSQALAIRSDYVPALNGRGNMLHELGRYDEALASYNRAIALGPDFADAHYNRANTLNALERVHDALDSYDQALRIQPTLAEAWFNQANTLAACDRPAEALASYDRLISLRPTHAEAYYMRGLALLALNRMADAVASFDLAIAHQPDHVKAWNERGASLVQLNRYEEGIASLERAVALKPDHAEAMLNIATARYASGDQAGALTAIEHFLHGNPMDPRGRVLQIMWTLPIISRSEDEAAASRLRYEALLHRFAEDLEKESDLGRFAEGIGIAQPFYLTYQGRDDRPLQELYGSLVCRIMAARYGANPSVASRDGERIRVGIVSGYFHRHVLWRMAVKGWLSQLDRRRFEVFCYYTGSLQDADTQAAVESCDRFVQGPMSVEQWRRVILSDAPQVLIYSEVGMDHMAARLASQRLASVQCNSLGHPVTCGFPTMDYYLSSEAMEPPDGDTYYVEQLVRLPNIGFYYEPKPPPQVKVTRAELGLAEGIPVFWCGQSLYKYLPRYDDVFPRIAHEVGNCQFAFIEYHGGGDVTTIFRDRLAKAFGSFGLDASRHCIFMSRMDEDRFVAAIGQCDIVLDSIGWAGNNSTLEGMANNVPIVAMAGPFMRGRHTSAMLNLIGSEETVAATPEEYVAIASRLVKDQDWRTAMERRIAERKHLLFRDRQSITALEEFLISAVRHSR